MQYPRNAALGVAVATLLATCTVSNALQHAVSAGSRSVPGFLTYDSLGGLPYSVTYDNRRYSSGSQHNRCLCCMLTHNHPMMVAVCSSMGRERTYCSLHPIDGSRPLLEPAMFCGPWDLRVCCRLLLSAGFHYPRFTQGQWDDVFLKAQSDGFNQIQVLIRSAAFLL
jgi:hypothetical protein